MNRDFEYLELLLEDFFSQNDLTKKLASISESPLITGWVNWLQIEFALFLDAHETQPEWKREAEFEMDLRKEKEKQTMKADFIIRKKGWKKDMFLALEMKQAKSPKQCVNLMIKDLHKVSKIKKSTDNMRSLWILGIFETSENASISSSELEDYEIVIHKKINNTNFSFIVI